MLTRLEVDGFKNLRGISVEFGPFTCIAGPNGVGKSNLFDAIELLSLLASHPIMEAAQRVRRASGARSADPRDLFWTDGRRRADTISLTAEMIVPDVASDAFGREAHASITFLRYEVEIRYTAPSGLSTRGHLMLHHESLTHINISDAHKHLRFPHKKRDFRDHIVKGRRSGGAFISTIINEEGHRVTQIHQDGGSRGRPRPSPTEAAPMTIVGGTTQASDPTILAAKREMESWRRLALEPAAMRSADSFAEPAHLDASGARLAATLYRLATHDPEATPPELVYQRISRRLAELIPVESLRVHRDDTLELLTVLLKLQRGPELPARSLSDGTLRFLALCVLDADPTATGLLCMEEPENGIHPARVEAMVDLLRGMAVDPQEAPGEDNPVRQLIVNTHSPLFVKHQEANDLLFAVEVSARSKGVLTRLPRFKPIMETWRCNPTEHGVSRLAILDYLERPPGSTLRLIEELAS